MLTESPRPPDEADKVAFLSAPEHYAEHTDVVSVVQTHHAWLFLTRDHAYKMKKAVRHGPYDFSPLDVRHALCRNELRLNRRLAERVYLDVAPIWLRSDGELSFAGPGEVVEWLVKMQRLPRDRCMDAAARAGRLDRSDIEALLRKLVEFYRRAPACSRGEPNYPRRLKAETSDVHRQLSRRRFDLPTALTRELVRLLSAYIDDRSSLLQSRQQGGRVREVHGDLRPEHVYFLPGTTPQIIDCLEFDRDLRCLDCLEEVAYLGMECRRLGCPGLESELREGYLRLAKDTAPGHLYAFYAARRAALRAVLVAWHLLDTPGAKDAAERSVSYLKTARAYLLEADRFPP